MEVFHSPSPSSLRRQKSLLYWLRTCFVYNNCVYSVGRIIFSGFILSMCMDILFAKSGIITMSMEILIFPGSQYQHPCSHAQCLWTFCMHLQTSTHFSFPLTFHTVKMSLKQNAGPLIRVSCALFNQKRNLSEFGIQFFQHF
jgi:hypothetical protein